MAFDSDSRPQLSFKFILKKIFRIAVLLLKFPFKVQKKYAYYNAILSLIYRHTQANNVLKIRQRNVLLVNLLILLPLYLGVFVTGFRVFQHKEKYQTYISRAMLPINADGVFSKIGKTVVRVYKMVVNQPVSLDEIHFLVWGFSICVFGSFIISQNTLFKESEKIQEVLMGMNKVDGDKKPWKVVWTPDAIYFEAYSCDPNSFVKETRFWYNISFKPANAKILDDNTKFIVPKKYFLPEKILFNFT